jgi:hypothetical protein
MRLRTVTTVMMGLMATQMAQAGDCESAYTMDDLLTDLAMIEGSLRNNDHAAANESSTSMAAGVACVDDIVPSVMVGRLYRAIGGGMFVGGDPDAGGAWMRTAAEVDAEFNYGEGDVSVEHPVRMAWKLAKVEVMGTEPATMEGAAQLVEASHYLDGRMIQDATATTERVHIYQQVIGDEMRTFRIEGNSFPTEAFSVPEPEPAPVVPEPVVAQVADPVKEIRQKSGAWPASRVMLLASGAASLGASGALYGMSSSARANFDASNTMDDMDQYRGAANTTFIGSGVAGVTGVSLIGVGLFFSAIDGDPRPTLDIRF